MPAQGNTPQAAHTTSYCLLARRSRLQLHTRSQWEGFVKEASRPHLSIAGKAALGGAAPHSASQQEWQCCDTLWPLLCNPPGIQPPPPPEGLRSRPGGHWPDQTPRKYNLGRFLHTTKDRL